MHDGADDDETSIGIGKRVGTLGNRYTVLLGALMLVDDVVFGADEHSRRAIELVSASRLSSGNCEHRQIASAKGSV